MIKIITLVKRLVGISVGIIAIQAGSRMRKNLILLKQNKDQRTRKNMHEIYQEILS
jgi:hypothetical protein